MGALAVIGVTFLFAGCARRDLHASGTYTGGEVIGGTSWTLVASLERIDASTWRLAFSSSRNGYQTVVGTCRHDPERGRDDLSCEYATAAVSGAFVGSLGEGGWTGLRQVTTAAGTATGRFNLSRE